MVNYLHDTVILAIPTDLIYRSVVLYYSILVFYFNNRA